MGEVTTNQDGPSDDEFARKVWREANTMSIETTCEGFSESIADEAAARVLSEAFDKVRAEERARMQSAAPGDVVEDAAQVIKRRAMEIAEADESEDWFAEQYAAAASTAATPAIRAQAVAEERARVVAWLRGMNPSFDRYVCNRVADALEQGAHENVRNK